MFSLERYNVNTAYDFSQMPVARVRKEMTVFGEQGEFYFLS